MIYYKRADPQDAIPGDYMLLKLKFTNSLELSLCVRKQVGGEPVNSWRFVCGFNIDVNLTPGEFTDGLPTVSFLKRFMAPELAELEYDRMRKG